MRTFPNFHVIDHPLVHHKLTLLRDCTTTSRIFKELVEEIALLMTFEATRQLPLKQVLVETPLMQTQSKVLDDVEIVLVPILRAGIGMVEGIVKLIPTARVFHLGLYRDHETLKPVQYYFKMPPVRSRNHHFILIDPMLATGGSAVAAAGILQEAGVKNLSFMCLIAAPEGVEKFCTANPDVGVFAAALDERLDERGYILPGLGDAGDRLFGTC